MDVLPEEEDDQDTYESVDEYLATRAATANVTPSAAPNYAAPPPPGVKPGEHDDHEYTPVKVTDGDVQVEPQEDVWAPLPLKKRISVPHVGLHSSPNQLRSPSVPHIGMNPAERGLVPSEPSPPPSSPSTRPPPSRGHDASDNSPEQPKLPPKKRREMSKLYSESDASKWRGSPPQVPTPQVLSLCMTVCSSSTATSIVARTTSTSVDYLLLASTSLRQNPRTTHAITSVSPLARGIPLGHPHPLYRLPQLPHPLPRPLMIRCTLII